MAYRRVVITTMLCCLLTFVFACAKQSEVKVDSVQVLYSDASEYTLVGVWEFHPAAFGIPKQLPKGPFAVWIFRDVPPEYQSSGVKAGNAYIPSGKGKFKLLCAVDLSLKDADIAAPFLKTQLLSDRKAADGNPELNQPTEKQTNSNSPSFVLTTENDPPWDVEGVLHYRGNLLVERQYWKKPPKTSAMF